MLEYITIGNILLLYKYYNYYVLVHTMLSGCYIVYRICKFGKKVIIYFIGEKPKYIDYNKKNQKLLDFHTNKFSNYLDWILI